MKQEVNQSVVVAGYGFDTPVCVCRNEEETGVWVGVMGEPIDPSRPILLRTSAGEDGNFAALLTPEEAALLGELLMRLSASSNEFTLQ